MRVDAEALRGLAGEDGDLVYVSDKRWWLGGLHSMHVVVGGTVVGTDDLVEIGPTTYELIVTGQRDGKPVKVERLY